MSKFEEQESGVILGINDRYYPSEKRRFDPPRTLAVLVSGSIGDYAVYVGHGSPEWVKQFGNKISFDEACCHFPGGQLEKGKYRD